MKAYYNEFDPYAAQWLRNLIDAGEIAQGDVDERSILDVTPTDLNRYDRCHFFAGIAGWDYALQLAGWPPDFPVWTGSCPCQPFSAAGRGGKGTDERHLWPAWFHLIRVCRPPVIFGEQVASKDGLKWLDLVCSDLEAEGYAVGAADLPACSVGAPHIRQRLWFVAYAPSNGYFTANGLRKKIEPSKQAGAECIRKFEGSSNSNLLDHSASSRCHGQEQGAEGDSRDETRLCLSCEGCSVDLMGNTSGSRCERDGLQQVRGGRDREGQDLCPSGPSTTGSTRSCRNVVNDTSEHPQHSLGQRETARREDNCSSKCSTHWSSSLWLPCRDGKARPTEPGIFPLAHGVSARVGRLRSYGNAIVPQVAAEFIRAFMESL